MSIGRVISQEVQKDESKKNLKMFIQKSLQEGMPYILQFVYPLSIENLQQR